MPKDNILVGRTIKRTEGLGSRASTGQPQQTSPDAVRRPALLGKLGERSRGGLPRKKAEKRLPHPGAPSAAAIFLAGGLVNDSPEIIKAR